MDGYRLFERGKQGERGREVTLYVMEGLDCMELMVHNGTIDSLWLGMKGQANCVDVIVNYRPHSQDGDTD